MNKRLFIPIFLAFICASLMAQPEIVSITYDGDVAILTTNTPPAGIVYYWQGTSCGTLMNHSSSTTVATTDGTYYLREYNSTGAVWSTSCASTIVLFPDVIPPVLSNVTPGPVDEGDHIAATSNEDGMIFLVPEGTAANYSAIVASRVASATATANLAVSLVTTGLSLGNYLVYAADDAHNVSAASAAILVTDLTPPILSGVTAGPVAEGDIIAATSNEDGMIYLVPDGTAANVGAIVAAKVSEAVASAALAVSLSTAGIGQDDYIVYAVDGHDNVSAASAVIAVVDLTAPILSDVSPGPVEPGDNIAATSNEDGAIYLVPDGTTAVIGAIVAAQVAHATVTANVPMDLVTTGVVLGDYIVFAVDGSDNVSASSAVIEVVDLTAPVLSGVTAGPIEVGTEVLATSNEDGMIYLVPDGTAANIGDITSAQLAQIAATANIAATLATTGIATGDYIVYAVDGSDNVSAASPVITVTPVSSIDPNDANPDQVILYPSIVTDILYIKSKVEVSSALVYSLQGAQVINITTATDRIDMSGLTEGVYIVKVRLLDDTIYTGKVNKQ